MTFIQFLHANIFGLCSACAVAAVAQDLLAGVVAYGVGTMGAVFWQVVDDQRRWYERYSSKTK